MTTEEMQVDRVEDGKIKLISTLQGHQDRYEKGFNVWRLAVIKALLSVNEELWRGQKIIHLQKYFNAWN